MTMLLCFSIRLLHCTRTFTFRHQVIQGKAKLDELMKRCKLSAAKARCGQAFWTLFTQKVPVRTIFNIKCDCFHLQDSKFNSLAELKECFPIDADIILPHHAKFMGHEGRASVALKKAVYPPLFLVTVEQFLLNYHKTMYESSSLSLSYRVLGPTSPPSKIAVLFQLRQSVVTMFSKTGRTHPKFKFSILGYWLFADMSHFLVGSSCHLDQLRCRTCCRVP